MAPPIALGLAYSHKEGIIHGNLHAGNILLQDDDSICLSEFGMGGVVRGEPRWRAPEIPHSGRNSAPPSLATDVYAFGCTAVELYMDQMPLSSLWDGSIGHSLLTGVQPASQFFCKMPDATWRLACSSCVSNASRRPSASKVVDTTRKILLLPPPMDHLNPIEHLIFDALQKDERKSMLLTLSETDAQLALDDIWTLLELPVLPDDLGVQSYVARNTLRRFLLKVSFEFDKLPAALFLEGVTTAETESRGIGGFADIYYGTYGDQPVAIKRLRAHVAVSQCKRDKLKQAFCRESLLWKNLSDSRHILPVLGVSETVFQRRTISMVLPWMAKGSIRHYLENLREHSHFGGQELADSIDEWLYQVALGLAYLQGEGIVHGDLHGGIILIDGDESVRLTDFGMALIAEAKPYQYGSPHGGGAIRWQAPELIDPEEFHLDSSRPAFATDIYSFACTCIELYTGEPPFSADLKDTQIQKRVVEGERPTRPMLMSDVTWDLVGICWSPHPSKRPLSDQVARALARISLVPSITPRGRYRPPTSDIMQRMQGIFAQHSDHISCGSMLVLQPPALRRVVRSFMGTLDFDILVEEEVQHGIQSEVSQPVVDDIAIYRLFLILAGIPAALEAELTV